MSRVSGVALKGACLEGFGPVLNLDLLQVCPEPIHGIFGTS